MADGEPETAGTPAARRAQPGGTFAPFRYPAFRAIWAANLASNLGSTIQSVGAAWLMTELTNSHQLIAMVNSSAAIPILLFSIFAGAIADNYDRRRVMMTAQVGMLLVSAVLAVLTWLDLMSPFLLLAFTFMMGMGNSLNSPAWQASVRQQVGLADLPQAISLNTIAFNLARSVGPALGGVLISIWNVALTFAINSASFISMIVVLLRWHPGAVQRERKPMLPAVAIGLRFCAGSSPIRRVLLRGFTLGFGISGYQALVPAAVKDQLHGSATDFGLMLGAFGIGSICAALFVSKARRRFGIEAVLAAGTLSFVFAQMVLAEASAVHQALPLSFVAGCGWVTLLTSLNVSMQLRSPENIVGRCLSIYQAVTFGAMALGSAMWGAVADWWSLPAALHGAAAFLIVTMLVLRRTAPMPKRGEGLVNAVPEPAPRT